MNTARPPMKKLLSLLVTAVAAGACLSSAHAQDNKGGDKKAGEGKADMCIGCHNIPGYQSSFPEVHKVPMIAGQGAQYIISALTAYKKGDRKHPTMRAIATSLTDQDMADLAAFYETMPTDLSPLPAKAEPAPPANVAALVQKANCTSCHGENFSKPIDPSYPKLAGQHADYLYVALKAYQTDKNPQIGRANPIMGGMARQYTHTELKQLAQYIASLPSDLRTPAQSRLR